MQEDMLTITQVAHLAECSSEWVRQLIRTGRLQAVITPLGRLVPRAEAERLAAERRARQARQAEVVR